MDEEKTNNPLKQLFNKSNSFLIIIPPDPSSDLISSALSLHQSLVSSNKVSQIGCETDLSSHTDIPNLDQIKRSVGRQNLHISFDFQEKDLQKVDYEISPEGKFSLLIQPKEGSPVPDSSSVVFSYSGASADLVIVFGINTLEELGRIYAEEKKFLDTANILSINNIGQEAGFTPNMFHLANTSFVEIICLLLQRIELLPNPEAAQNLLTFLYRATNNLSSPQMTADTFANISYLMKQGASLPFQAQNGLFPNSVSLPRPTFFNQPAPNQVPADWNTPKIFKAGQLPIESTDKI